MRALFESNIYFISPTNSPRRQFNDHDNSPGDAILIFSAMQFAEKCVLEEITGVTNALSSHDRENPRKPRDVSRRLGEAAANADNAIMYGAPYIMSLCHSFVI